MNADGTPNYSAIQRCACKADVDRAEREARLLKFCEMPAESENMTLETLKGWITHTEAFEVAKAMALKQGPIKWLTLQGDVGRGKTHLAIAICREWLKRGWPAKYAYVPLLLSDLRQGVEEDAYKARLHTYLHVPLLVLDDLGTEKPTDWVTEQLTTIIDQRMMSGLYMVVTTNKLLSELPGDKEHRIMSRLRRYPWCKVVVLDGPEYKLKGG